MVLPSQLISPSSSLYCLSPFYYSHISNGVSFTFLPATYLKILGLSSPTCNIQVRHQPNLEFLLLDTQSYICERILNTLNYESACRLLLL